MKTLKTTTLRGGGCKTALHVLRVAACLAVRMTRPIMSRWSPVWRLGSLAQQGGEDGGSTGNAGAGPRPPTSSNLPSAARRVGEAQGQLLMPAAEMLMAKCVQSRNTARLGECWTRLQSTRAGPATARRRS